MNYSLVNLYHKTVEEIITVLKAIPKEARLLIMSNNGLFSRGGSELAEICRNIPEWITRLDLSLNNLEQLPSTEMVVAFSGFPKNIYDLNIGWNNLGISSEEDIITLFKTLPPTITHLNISYNVFSARKLERAVVFLNKNVIHLNLQGNVFYLDETAQVVKAFKAFPEHVTELILSRNELQFKAGIDLVKIFKAFSKRLISLDLSNNKLWMMHWKDLARAIGSISRNLRRLNLSMNSLGNKDGAGLTEIFKSISENVTHLDLSKNDFFIQNAFPTTLQSLHYRLIYINLSANFLGKKSTNELVDITGAISNPLTTINLEDNKLFSYKSSHEIDELLSSLPGDRSRYILANNGESQFARSVGAMVSFSMQYQIPLEMIQKILQFLLSSSPSEKQQNFVGNKTSEVWDKIVLIKIRKAASEAQTKFALHYSQLAATRTHGFFNSPGPDDLNQRKAAELIKAIHDPNNTLDEVKKIITQFINDSSKFYLRNSFAPFLLDELSSVWDTPWYSIQRNGITNLYDKEDVGMRTSLNF